MRLVCISDTHNKHAELDVPPGDVLVHAGDFTRRGGREEVEAFGQFLAALPHAHKVVVAGNHDFLCEHEREEAEELLGDVTYLQDSEAVIDGVRFWGSPWQPEFFDWAFNLPRGEALAQVWAQVPDGVDVLVTHGPPFGVLDTTRKGLQVGCHDLLAALERIRPRVHVFGHIHEAYGVHEEGGTTFVNACSCDVRYRLRNAALVVDL